MHPMPDMNLTTIEGLTAVKDELLAAVKCEHQYIYSALQEFDQKYARHSAMELDRAVIVNDLESVEKLIRTVEALPKDQHDPRPI